MLRFDFSEMLIELEESRSACAAVSQKLDIMFGDAYWSASKSHEIQTQASIQFPSHEEEEICPRHHYHRRFLRLLVHHFSMENKEGHSFPYTKTTIYHAT